ncbi:MAG TPA: aldo/keto reductase [Methylomirabilota bacterium]|nr:aldo/keto reductase [Methylomirabilota bacterium]
MSAANPVLEGSATPGGTASYASRFASSIGAGGYTSLGSAGLTVSRLGFGCYRVDDETAEHRQALEHALLKGVNLIDTSTNYTDGGSERLVGAVLRESISQGALRREEVVVVSKIGYAQGMNLALAQEREVSGQPFPEMVKYMEDCWHCVHPEFIQDQLGRSLERLGLQTLDVCLLHNPEYFFLDARKRNARPLGELRDEFYRRLTEAFRFLESEARAGKIRWYGVSSNSLGSPANDPEATSLARMLEAAREAGGATHHFAVAQFPMNLFEAGGAREQNNGPGHRETVLETASRERIGVLVNRPLNAITDNGMVRLADFSVGEAEVDLEQKLRAVGELEAEYHRDIAPRIELPSGSTSPADFFRWADQLRELEEKLQSLEHWRDVTGRMILPHIRQIANAFNRMLSGTLAERWQAWWTRYSAEFREVLVELGRRAGLKSQSQSLSAAALVDPFLPPERRRESLSRKALWVLASTPGVSAVLNGMRHPGYVDDSTGILGWPLLEDVLPIYKATAKDDPER